MITCTKPALVITREQFERMAKSWYGHHQLMPAGDPDNANRSFEELTHEDRNEVYSAFSSAFTEAGVHVPMLRHDEEDEDLPEDVHALMRDPRYWRDHDPIFVEKVTDAYRRKFHPDETGL